MDLSLSVSNGEILARFAQQNGLTGNKQRPPAERPEEYLQIQADDSAVLCRPQNNIMSN